MGVQFYRKRVLKSIIAWIVLFVCVFYNLSSPISVFATGASGGSTSASEAEGIGTSLYEVSTALSAYANDVVGPNANDKHDTHELSEMNAVGNAGAYVGYGDEDAGFHAYIASNTARSVTTSSYEAWTNAGDGGKTYAYVRYGHLLKDLGLDSTAPNTAGAGGRAVTGILTQGIYGLSSFVSKIFEFMMDILEMLNPFRLFSRVFTIDEGVDKVKVYKDVTGGNAGHTYNGFEVKATKGPPMSSGYRKIVKFVSNIYKDVQKLGFVLLPLFLVMMLTSVILLNSKNKSRRILVYFERAMFITCGVPLLGFFYTAMLSTVETVTKDNPAATQIVGQTYVDFQNWVTDSRLALPAGVGVSGSLVSNGEASSDGSDKSPAGSASNDTVRTARKTVWVLNKKMGIVTGAYKKGAGDYNDTAGVLKPNGTLMSETATKLFKDNINNLLTRYQGSDFYQASAFETAVNGAIHENYKTEMGNTPGTGNATSNDEKVYQMYGDTNESQDWLDREIDDNKAIFAGTTTTDLKWPAKSWNLFKTGKLSATGTFSVDGNIRYSGGNWSGKATDPGKNGGLSTVAMYNYLSTAFEDSSVQVYSAIKSTSEYVKQSHYAVNLIGTDMLRVAYGANCIVVMGVIVIITFVYAIGMIVSNIKRMLHLLMSIPAAMMGVLRSIAQVIVYTVMMVVELIATVFVYEFVCDLIVMMGSVLEEPIEEVIAGSSIIGGRLAFIGEFVSTHSFYDSRWIFILGMFVLLLALIGVGVGLKKLSRVVLSVYEFAWCKLLYLATFDELRPAFDAWMAERDSLYVWDKKPKDKQIFDIGFHGLFDFKGVQA